MVSGVMLGMWRNTIEQTVGTLAQNDGFTSLRRPYNTGDNYHTMTDPINPDYYRKYRVEVIDILEDAVAQAPDPVKGSLQYQVLKYLLRIWNKENPLQDARKSRWYLDRLILKLEQQNLQNERDQAI